MAIDKIFNDANVDGIADNIFGAVNNSVSEVKAMQQRKAAENVQMVVEAFKKIETNITEKFDNVTDVIEKRVLTIKDGRDGSSGTDGRNGRDGKPGRDGVNGKQGTPGTPGKDGTDGVDGVSVTNANIDFDGSLVISLSSGQQINVGEVVAPDLAEKIKIVSTMSTNGAVGIKDEGTSITAGVKIINFVGATVTATNSGDDVTVNVSAGTGTVQSVAATVPAFLSVAGSPITTTGTLAISLSGTALPVANGGTGITSFGTGVATALGVNVGTAGAFVVNGGALGTPSSGTVTNLTGTASININGTVGATTPGTGAFTTLSATGTVTVSTTANSNVNAINIVNSSTGAAAGIYTGYTAGTTPFYEYNFGSGYTTSAQYIQSSKLWESVGSFSISSGHGAGGGITRFYVNDTLRTQIDTTGLAVTGTLSATGTLSGGTSGTGYSFSGSAPATSLTLNSSGNLGLGVTPSAWLSGSPAMQFKYYGSIWNASDSSMHISENGYYNGSDWIYLSTAAASNYYQTAGTHIWRTAASGTAGNAISFTQAMTLDASGRLGVGTTSPSSYGGWISVDIRGSNGGQLIVANSAATNIGEIFTDSNGFNVSARTNNAMLFKTNDTERARIDSSGSLQLKKASNETEATAQFSIAGSGYEAYHWLDATAYYIGQNSSIRSLRIYSNSYTAGVNLASGGTSWGTFSDERLKYDVEPITNGLDKLNSIRCVSYRLKDVDASDSQKKLGVIAQDLVGVVDEVIDITKRHGDETDYMSVRYTELIPVLVKAIQEQQALITQLTARITALETA